MNLCLASRFDEFLETQPDVARAFLEAALAAQASGRRIGAKAIVEAIRWQRVTSKGPEFKIDNTLTAPLARWAMEQEPKLRGYFETRGE